MGLGHNVAQPIKKGRPIWPPLRLHSMTLMTLMYPLPQQPLLPGSASF